MLTVSLPQLAVGAGEPALAEATVEVVRPGDPVRISNVLDVVLPDVARTTPPPPSPACSGRPTRRCRAASTASRASRCSSTCDWRPPGYAGARGASRLASSTWHGPGADRSPWGATSTSSFVSCRRPASPSPRLDAAIRRATLAGRARPRRDHGRGRARADVATLGGRPRRGRDLCRPSSLILQVASEGPLIDTFLDGEPLARRSTRSVARPAGAPDGALTNGAYDWPAVRNVTAVYQDNALVRELLARAR